MLLVLTGSVLTITPSHASSNVPSQPVTIPSASIGQTYQVSLDANSLSQTDVNVATNALQGKSFRIGAVINSSTISPLMGVYGWQFAISYNPSVFAPQGDPGSSWYPDGATNTVLFGSQTTRGTVNWAGRIEASQAFGGSTLCLGDPVTCPTSRVYVYFTLLNPATAVSISANTILANVNFELLARPTTPQSFNITNVKFDTSDGVQIPGPVAGPPVVETITNAPPIASFTKSPDSTLGQFAFVFNASASTDPDGSIPNPAGYFWDFGDGTQDLGVTGRVVTHDYRMNSSFVVTLRIQDVPGATGAARDSAGAVIFNDQPSHAVGHGGTGLPPIARFTYYPANGPTGSTHFDASNSISLDGSIVFYHWDFGDGTFASSHESTIDHYYASMGNYTVSLTATNIGGLASSVSALVTVQPPSIVAVDVDLETPGIQSTSSSVSGIFQAGVDVVNVTSLSWWQFQLDYDPALVSFLGNLTLGPFWQNATSIHQAVLNVKDNQTAGIISVSFSWLGQASNFTGSSVLAIFTFLPLRSGIGTLSLSGTTLVDYPLHSMTITQDGTVAATTPGDLAPSSIFEVCVYKSPPDECVSTLTNIPRVGQTVFFKGGFSYDPDGFIQSWSWSFGDGSTALGVTVSHVYYSTGNYNVSLTVQDNAALSVTSSTMVMVVSPQDKPPIPVFTISPMRPSARDTVHFDGNASYDPDGFIESWYWIFGDGHTDYEYRVAQVAHSYNSPGNYVVILIVYDNAGLSATVNRTISVLSDPPLNALFTFSPSNPKVRQKVSFDGTGSASSDGSIQSWSWSFGDGSIGSGPLVQHSYRRPGNYTVSLTILDSGVTSANVTMIVPVHPNQLHKAVAITASSGPGCEASSYLSGDRIRPGGCRGRFYGISLSAGSNLNTDRSQNNGETTRSSPPS